MGTPTPETNPDDFTAEVDSGLDTPPQEEDEAPEQEDDE